MSVNTVEERVRAIVAEELGMRAENIETNSRFDGDLGADSIDLIELVIELEDEFCCDIPDEHAVRITTVGEAVDYIEAYANGG